MEIESTSGDVANTEENNKVKNSKIEEFFVFNPILEPLQTVFSEYKSLTKLIVVNQNIVCLEGIEKLQNLEELWIVDGNIQQKVFSPVNNCLNLKRLYLYGNELIEIPDFRRLEKLEHLWLSDNKISSLQNVSKLLSVKELYLCNNKITKIDVRFKSTMKVVCLNLSGNPLKSFKDIPKLSLLKSLRWLMLLDPLYRRSPVTLLAHFRPFVIYSLPELQCLDLVQISRGERKAAAEFYKSKLQFYRLTLYNALARNFSALKTNLESKNKEFELIWCALHHHGAPEKIKAAGEKIRNFKFWETEAQRWKERNELSLFHYKMLAEVTKKKIQLELEYSGNLCFNDVDLSEPIFKEQLLKKMDSFLCSYLKGKVSEIHLLNVWTIQGDHFTTIIQSQFKGNWDDIFILKPVQELSSNLLQFVEEFLFGANIVKAFSVANCLACADSVVADITQVHRQLLLRSLNLLDSRILLLCGVLGGAQLFQREQIGEPCHSPKCCSLFLPKSSELVPLYLVHFQYVFQDYFKPLKVPPTSVSSSSSAIPLSLSQNEMHKITKLNLSNCNLHKLEVPVMDKVTSVDLSYNYIEDLYNIGKIFPKLVSLDLTFNKICSLQSLQVNKGLTRLVLKWNLITEFLGAMQRLKDLSLLKHLDLSWNPFTDVLSNDRRLFLVGQQLNLISFNGHLIPRTVGQVPVLGQDKFPSVPAWCCPRQCLTLKWKAELSREEKGNHLGVINNHTVNVTLQELKLTQFHSVLPLGKLKWLDLSRNVISDTSFLKGLSALQEVNLSRNMILSFNGTVEKLKYLTKLNISHNYLNSLNTFSAKYFPNLKLLDLSNNFIDSLAGLSGTKSLLELYLSHNLLKNCETLVHLKTCRDLQVLDVSYNPVAAGSTFRQNCLYHLSSLKFINGSRVQDGEMKSALVLYGGLLDQDYLIKVYSQPTLMNLTTLSLSNHSIKKVSLSEATFVNVTSVSLDHNKISSLDWLCVFPNLDTLSLNHNQVTGYSGKSLVNINRLQPPSHAPERPFTSLQCLSLDHNRIRNLQPLRLDLFPNLKALMLSENEISSLAGLKNNFRLEHLVLTSNSFTAISPEHTAVLVNLIGLYLERNSLFKLDFLCPLKKLQKLFIGFNKIVSKSSLTPLTELPELTELTIHGNPLFRRSNSYLHCLPDLPNLRKLEGHFVNCDKN